MGEWAGGGGGGAGGGEGVFGFFVADANIVTLFEF